MVYKSLYIFILGIFLFSPAYQLVSSEPENPQGYTDIVHFRDKFFAVGTDGRIDCISQSGESATIDRSNPYKLNCAFSNDEILIAVGEHGTILYSCDGKTVNHAESGTEKDIHTVASQDGLILAGSEKGLILASTDCKSWNQIQTDVKGNILSLASNNSFFIGVTDAGEIIKSDDGMNWEIKDYNEEYAGYNPYSKFKKILATQNTIVIIGTHDDDSPSILSSVMGTPPMVTRKWQPSFSAKSTISPQTS